MIEFMHNSNPTLYYIFILIGTAVVAIWNLAQTGKMKLITSNVSKSIINYTKKRNERFPADTITAIAEIVIITLFQYVFAGDYNIWFGKISI